MGRKGSIFELPYDETEKFMTTTWLKQTIKFAQEIELKIEASTPSLRTWREGDTLLMEHISKVATHVTNEEMKAFNRCRIHLQVTMLADLTNGMGTHVHKPAWECKKQWTSISANAYQWTAQPRPTKQDRLAWKKILQQTFGVDPRFRNIPRRLGDFYRTARKHLDWMYNRTEESLYRRREDGWHRWKRI